MTRQKYAREIIKELSRDGIPCALDDTKRRGHPRLVVGDKLKRFVVFGGSPGDKRARKAVVSTARRVYEELRA